MPDENGNLTAEEALQEALDQEEAERQAALRQQDPVTPQGYELPPTTALIAHQDALNAACDIIRGELSERYDVKDNNDPVIRQMRDHLLGYPPEQLAQIVQGGKNALAPWIDQSTGILERSGKRKDSPRIQESGTGTGNSGGAAVADVKELYSAYGENRVKGVFKEIKEANQGRTPTKDQMERALRRS